MAAWVVEGSEESAAPDVTLIVGGGPGISASCARLFARQGMRVAIAARNPEKPVLRELESVHNARVYSCDASDARSVDDLFEAVTGDLGAPALVVHNIDGRVPEIFGKKIVVADAAAAFATIKNAAFSAFLIGQRAARAMLGRAAAANGAKGTIIFTNASASLKGFPKSAAFAMACHAKTGLAESMARELMPRGVHVCNVPIDAAVGWTQADGTRSHRRAGMTKDDNMADPDRIAELYWQLHHQHRSTWAFEVVLRPWLETW